MIINTVTDAIASLGWLWVAEQKNLTRPACWKSGQTRQGLEGLVVGHGQGNKTKRKTSTFFIELSERCLMLD